MVVKISTTPFNGHSFSIVYTNAHLIFSGFFDSNNMPHDVISLNPVLESDTIAKEVCDWYENGSGQLPMPMNLKGTLFQTKVWKALSEIPKGSVLKYKDLAAAVQHPLAVRAAGTACGKNPFTLIIPCHRVVGISSLGGYRWGLPIKEMLLNIEGISL